MRNNLQTRAASLAPSSYDEKAHTIEVEVSTENPVKGVSLSHERSAIDLSRFIGAPFLNAHKRDDVRDVLGKIIAARVEARKLIATVKLTRRADAADIIQDILDGIIPQTSVGFTVAKWGADSIDQKTGARTRTATRWRPFEVSVVPYGADETTVRAESANPGEKTRSPFMKKKNAPGAENAPESDVDANAPANDNTVSQTRAEIRAVFKRALPNDLARATTEADAIIDADGDIAEANARALEIVQERTANPPRVRVVNAGPSPEQTRDARAEALAVRIGGGKPSDQARAFVGYGLVEHARDMLEANGDRVRGMNAEQILTRAMHTISDFPELLTGTGARLLKPAYEAARSPLAALTRKATAGDFRPQSTLQLGELPKLQKVSEAGEIKSATRGEAKETWALETYGSIFSLSRKALVNDDLGAFADFASAAGQAAAATEADLIVQFLTQSGGQGPLMGDGKRLFHVDHGNIYTAAGTASIELGAISLMRKHMLLQTGVDGQTIINVRPDTIVVPPSRLTEAEQFVAAYTAQTYSGSNPFTNALNVVCEPRLEAVSEWGFYLADSRHPALVLGSLAGYAGPQIASRDGFEVLGREFRVTLDVGVGPNDWRGWSFNGGEDSNSAGA